MGVLGGVTEWISNKFCVSGRTRARSELPDKCGEHELTEIARNQVRNADVFRGDVAEVPVLRVHARTEKLCKLHVAGARATRTNRERRMCSARAIVVELHCLVRLGEVRIVKPPQAIVFTEEMEILVFRGCVECA